MPISIQIRPNGEDLSKAFDVDRIVKFQHDVHASELMQDDTLVDLLDNYPADAAVVHAMDGSGHARDWKLGTIGTQNGRTILDAIGAGHLWLNLKDMHEHVEVYRELLDALYAQVAAIGGVTAPTWTTMGMLLSSPNASVPFHADAVSNILWQIRGRKRVFFYPAKPPFLEAECLEKICANETMEEMPYDDSYEDSALHFDLEPGEAIVWPQHTPHRVVNLEGMNISLTTEHLVPESRRLVRVYRANLLKRRFLRRPARSTTASGAKARAKALVAIADGAWRRFKTGKRVSYDLTPSFEIDPTVEGSIRWLEDSPQTR